MAHYNTYPIVTATQVDDSDLLINSEDLVTAKMTIAEAKKTVNTISEVEVSTTTYTLLATDQNKIVRAVHVDAKTFTVPPTAGFNLGEPIILRNAASTDITLVEGSGVTVNASSLVVGQNLGITLTPRALNNWDLNI